MTEPPEPNLWGKNESKSKGRKSLDSRINALTQQKFGEGKYNFQNMKECKKNQRLECAN